MEIIVINIYLVVHTCYCFCLGYVLIVLLLFYLVINITYSNRHNKQFNDISFWSFSYNLLRRVGFAHGHKIRKYILNGYYLYGHALKKKKN
jgi:uncharacterized membrane protein YccF (DUF307 family)